MKKFISSIFLIIMSVLLCVAGLSGCAKPNNEDSGKGPSGEETQEEKWKEDGILKILTVGNSFSDDTMEYVWQIANDLGVENIYLGNLFIGGCTLDTHALNAKNNNIAYDYRVNSNGSWKTERYRMGDALSEQNWDFVSLQQASGSSGMKDTYKELGYLVDYVKEKAPNAQIVWNMTWAYQQNSNHSEFYKYDYKGIENMLNAIQQGIILDSTKKRLSDLEEQKKSLELELVQEQIKSPILTKEQIMFGITKFRTLDLSTQKGRQTLIDSFVNAIYLYDDYALITCNYKDGSIRISFEEIEGSDLLLDGTPAGNRTRNGPLGGGCYIHLTTEVSDRI